MTATLTRSKTKKKSQASKAVNTRSSIGGMNEKHADMFENPQSNSISAQAHQHANPDTVLDPKEFGPLESTEFLYEQNHPPGSELPVEDEDLPKYYTFITTYICYLVLIIIGHIKDYISKYILRGQSSPTFSSKLRPTKGYAPLLSDFDSFYTRRLKHRLGDCFSRPTTGVPGRFITVIDRETHDYNDSFQYTGTTSDCLNLASYNYLGFAQSVGQCTDAAQEAIQEHGLIAGGTRAAGGTMEMHYETERVVADFVGKESAMLYSMGYATNANIFANLVDKNCLVISDELNHASIRFGVRMSRSVIKIFKHNDMEDLEKLIREQISQGQPRTHRPWKKILVVVEGLYSMEGTMCNLPALVKLREKYKFHLFVDEAHSIGAMGKNGRGVCDYFSVDPAKIDILMGTLTKSFGATGGYIAGDKEVIDHLKIHNMANVYAEAIAPPVLAQIQSSLKTISGEIRPGEGQERLQRLAFNSRYLRLGLIKLGFLISGAEDSPIIPLMLYQPSKMPAFSRFMLKKKIAVVIVGYPATPLTSSRVRFCVSAALTKSDLDRLLEACDEAGNELHLKNSQIVSKKTGNLFRGKLEDILPTLAEDVHKDWSEL